jgi:hypothetical protein
MNILTLVGLIMTGFGLTLRRTARAGLPLCLSVMGVTALVLAGLPVRERLASLAAPRTAGRAGGGI